MSFGSPIAISSRIGTIFLDAVINEDHLFRSRVTENPIESGVSTTDNIIPLPFVLNMTARVSDASLIPLVPSFGSKAIDAFNSLVEMQTNSQLANVTTGVREYVNMAIEEIGVPRQSQDGNSLRFELLLREILIVGQETETNRELISEDVRHTFLAVDNKGTVQKDQVS